MRKQSNGVGETLDADNPKRNAILIAAARLFLEHGYEPVSMDAIAAAADVSKRTVYAYFESKTALFSAIMIAHCGRMSSIAPPEHPTLHDPRKALADFARVFLRMMTSLRTVALQRVIFREAERLPEIGKIFFQNGPGRHVDKLSAYLQQAEAAGKLEIVDPACAAILFLAMVQAPFHLQQLCGLVDDVPETAIEQAIKEPVELFLKAHERREGREQRSVPVLRTAGKA